MMLAASPFTISDTLGLITRSGTVESSTINGIGFGDFNSATGAFSNLVVTPEPTSLGLLGFACVGMLARRRRQA